jgi:hypothetical protein
MKLGIAKLSILIVILTALFTDLNIKQWQNPHKVIEWDVISYYAYLPAYFIYDDVSLKFKENYHGSHHFVFWGKKLPNGNYLTKTTMGLSFMYAPFFAIGHTIAKLTSADDGGFSWPYRLSLILSALFYLTVGLWFLHKILLRYFSELTVAITLFAIGMGTNLFYYSTLEAGMSHVYNFTLFVLLIYVTPKWYEKQSLINTLKIGVLLGLLTLIRPINILSVLIFALYGISSWNDFKLRLSLFIKQHKSLILMTIIAFLVILPQLFYWKHITGQWIYYSYTKERFFFDSPQIVNVLFSFRKGFFIYTPIMLLSVIGFFMIKRFSSSFFLASIVLFSIYLYVISSWWTWWYGGSFGMRPLIDIYGIMAFGLAATTETLLKQTKKIKYAGFVFLILFTTQGIWFNMKYHYGSIHWDSMTKAAYFDSFFRLHPSPKFYSLLQPPNYDAALLGLSRNITLKKSPYFEVSETTSKDCNGLSFFTDFEAIDKHTTSQKAFAGNYSYWQNKVYSPIIQLQKTDLLGLPDRRIEYCFSALFYSDSLSKCDFSIVASSLDGKTLYQAHDFKKLKNKKNWIPVTYKDTLDTIPETIKFYFWNHDTLQSFYVDNLKLTFRQLP